MPNNRISSTLVAFLIIMLAGSIMGAGLPVLLWFTLSIPILHTSAVLSATGILGLLILHLLKANV